MAVITEELIDTATPPAPPAQEHRLSPPLTRQRFIMNATLVVLTISSIASLWWVGVNPVALWEGAGDIWNLLGRMLPPRIEEPGIVVSQAIDTFLMAFAGTVLGVVLAIPVAILAASNLNSNRYLRGIARAIIVLTRALPDLVLALIFVRVYGIGVVPGLLAIGIHSVGMLGKLFADSIEQIEAGPREGVAATGSGRMQEFMTGVWPQIVPSFIAISLYRLDINFRGATLLGLVGAGGIGLSIRAHSGSLDYPQLLGVTLVIMALVVLVEFVSTSVRSQILGHSRTKKSGFGKWFGRSPEASDFVPDANVSGADQMVASNPSLRPPWTAQRVTMWGLGIFSAIFVVLAFVIPDISFGDFLIGLPEIPNAFLVLIPVSMDWWQDRWMTSILETIAMGVGATGLSLLLAIPSGLLAARNAAPFTWVYAAARLFILLVRALPELIVAVVFVAALGLGPLPGVLALAIGLYGFSTKLFADSFEEIHEGPRDGVRATGAGGLQEIVTSVLPQALPAIVAHSLYVLDGSLRASAVLGIVGAGGIGYPLSQGMALRQFELVGGLLIIVFILVYLIELVAVWVRKQII